MRAWLTSTLLLCAFVAGCLAHERPGQLTDAGGTLADTSTEARDVGPPPPMLDAALVLDAGPAPACTLDETSVGVRIEPVTAEVARCAFTHADGATLMGIDGAPADDGIRVHLDLCPLADADCRCDVVVSHVGTDVASDLGPVDGVVIDLAQGEGFFPGAYLSITKVPTCECNGCGCSEPLYLYAASAPPDFAQHVPAPMTFSNGPTVCPMADCTFGGSSMLHAVGDAGEADIPGGEQRDIGPVHVRTVRDVEVFAPCAACAGCGTPTGAWIAWISSALTP